MRKKITKGKAGLIKHTLKAIQGCIERYVDLESRGMCNVLDEVLYLLETPIDSKIKIERAFKTTQPDGRKYGEYHNYWYRIGDSVSRLAHMKRLQKELKDFIKNNS